MFSDYKIVKFLCWICLLTLVTCIGLYPGANCTHLTMDKGCKGEKQMCTASGYCACLPGLFWHADDKLCSDNIPTEPSKPSKPSKPGLEHYSQKCILNVVLCMCLCISI